MVDATDLKSVIHMGVWVRLPPLAPNRSEVLMVARQIPNLKERVRFLPLLPKD